MAGPNHDHADAVVATPDAFDRTSAIDLERPGPAGATRPSGAARGQRSAPDASPVDQAPRRDRLTRRRTLALQRTAGNRAVSGLLRHIQRVEVKEKKLSETLYNQKGAG
ncbi:MAG: hypothetical protein ABWZ82_09590, partial [Candidatus Limnocylindrales bacterium]